MIKKYDAIKDIGNVILGNIILAIGVSFFIVPNSILSGGVPGIAVALSPLIHIDASFIINFLTIALFFLGLLVLGKMFALKTLFSAVLYPIFVSLFGVLAESYTVTTDPILASLYGGVFVGIGIGLVFKTGSSTGGMDIPSLILHKYTHIPLSTLVFIIDGLTVLFGMSIYGVEAALIGLISVVTTSVMVNKTMMMGMAEAKSIMIVSDKYEEILEKISEEVNRGATIIEAKGGYTKNDKPMLMVVILKKQFPEVNKIIQRVDPGAFVIVHDVNEVQGEGFTYNQEVLK